MRIATFADHAEFGDRITEITSSSNHRVKQFREAEALLRNLEQDSLDLILLDWTGSDSGSARVLSLIREKLNRYPPTINFIAGGSCRDIVTALNSGADECLIRPVSNDVLKSRINALLHRFYGGPALVAI